MVGSELCRATRAAWRWARLRASTGADHAADLGPMSTAAASPKDVTAFYYTPRLQLGRGFSLAWQFSAINTTATRA
jgi:hypothetical protein